MRYDGGMDTAVLAEGRQLTLPVTVAQRLNVSTGDKVAFVETELNRFEVMPQSEAALLEIKRKLRGIMDERGSKRQDKASDEEVSALRARLADSWAGVLDGVTEDDIPVLVKKIRRENRATA